MNSHEAILNCMSEAVYVVNSGMEILYANPASEELTGYSASEAIGARCENVFCEVSERCWQGCPPKLAIAEQRAILHREALTRAKSGEIKNTQISFSPFFEGDKCVGAVVVIKDITDIRKAEEQIKRQNELFRLTVDSLPHPFCVLDADNYQIDIVNKACGREQSSEGATCYTYTHGSPRPCENDDHPCPLDTVKKTRQPYVVEHIHKGPDGEDKNYEVHGYPILDDNNNVVKMIEYVVDITDRKNAEIEKERMQERLRILAITDDLTGLYSRRGFFSLAEHQLQLAGRMKNELLLLYADIDNLKMVNDRFGHAEGSDLIRVTAGILKDCFRSSDIIARIGGDEFVVLSLKATDETHDVVINRIQKKIESMNKEEKLKHPVSLSIGCAPYNPSDPCAIEELLNRADKSMYEEKSRKRGVGPSNW